MKKLMIGAVCAIMAAATFAEPSVKITKAYQKVPGSGIVECSYKVSGFDAGRVYNLLIEVGAEGCEKTETVTIWNVAEGSATKSVDVKTLLGKAYPNVTLFAELKMSGVQLWAGGPCFAECNVGANSPEEYGYYFWWGDTVGYTNSGSEWVSVVDGRTTIKFSNESPANTLYGKDPTALANYVDAKGNLKSDYDAATEKLGLPWRMMTREELDLLVANCDVEWTDNWNNTGIKGKVVKGKGDYAANSVFFPAAGYGNDSGCSDAGSGGYYWSSTSDSANNSVSAWTHNFKSDGFYASRSNRYRGFPVRPVRDAE